MNGDLLLAGGVATGSVLAGGGVSILAVELWRGSRLGSSVLAQRWLTWLTWLVLAPVWLLTAASTSFRALALTGAAVVAAREYGRLRPRLTRPDRTVLVGLALMVVPVTALIDVAGFVAVAVLAVSLTPLWSQDVEHGASRIADLAMVDAVIHVPLAMLWAVGELAGGGVLLGLGLAVAMSDIGAFVVGNSFGGRRLAPVLSPNKTRAGTVGNFVGAAAGSGLALAIGAFPLLYALAMPVLVAVGAVWGDLLESLLKREAGVKDAGTWLPGFGGILDRIDSLLVVALLGYLFIAATGGL